MKSTELRIGNYLNIYGRPEKVESIGTWGCSFKDSFAKYTLPNLQPIPLTEEIIIKCGFEKEFLDDDDYYYSLKLFKGGYNNLSFLYGQSEAYLFPYEDITFKYLHQLQNAYHSITGKELEVNI